MVFLGQDDCPNRMGAWFSSDRTIVPTGSGGDCPNRIGSHTTFQLHSPTPSPHAIPPSDNILPGHRTARSTLAAGHILEKRIHHPPRTSSVRSRPPDTSNPAFPSADARTSIWSPFAPPATPIRPSRGTTGARSTTRRSSWRSAATVGGARVGQKWAGDAPKNFEKIKILFGGREFCVGRGRSRSFFGGREFSNKF